MIVTGFVLWFPVFVTKFLPGIFIPLSKTVHTSEAMLIFILVITWHIYDSVLSPDVFPFNGSIFTGYAKKKQMKMRELSATGEDIRAGEPGLLVDRNRPL